jgi:hypothetical protein
MTRLAMNKKNLGVALIGPLLLLALTIAVMVASFSMPLLSTLGFEAGSLMTAIFGPLYFLTAALSASPMAGKNFRSKLLRNIYVLGFHYGLLLIWLGYNGLFAQSCSDASGLVPFLVVSLPPLLLNISLGTLVAVISRRAWLAFGLSLLFYVGYYFWIAYSWWLEPSFRILTHLSFLTDSDLMQGATLSPPIYAFRLATLCFAACVILIGSRFLHSSPRQMFNIQLNQPVTSLLAIATFLLIGAYLQLQSLQALGKNQLLLEKNY